MQTKFLVHFVIFLICGTYCSCVNENTSQEVTSLIFRMVKVALSNPEFNKTINYFLVYNNHINVYNSSKLDTNLIIGNRTYFIINKVEQSYYNEMFKKSFIRVEYKIQKRKEGVLYLYFYPLKSDGIIGVTHFSFENKKLEVKKAYLGHFEMAIPMSTGDSVIAIDNNK